MILYAFLVLFLVILLFSAVVWIDASIVYVQIFFWAFGLIGLLSVLYLELSQTYIIEQFRFAAWNGAAIALAFMFFWHLVGVVCGAALVQRQIKHSAQSYRSRLVRVNKGRWVYWAATLILLLIIYLNLFVSDTPPLLVPGYVDRFGYIYSTKLWWMLSPFGVVTVPLPIMLGWLLSTTRMKVVVVFLFWIYLLYLALIGQKFGGFVLAFFLLMTPTVIKRVAGMSFYRIALKLAIIGGALLTLALGVVYYHYSQYSLSEEFGGPLGLIAYRIFGLQGHSFWGAYDYFIQDPYHYFDPASLYEGMQAVMRLIAPTIADEMIARGVSFTFGYFGSLLINLNILSLPLLVLVGFVHSLLAYYLIICVLQARLYSYFVVVNLVILFNAFVSMGSTSYIFNFKALVLAVILIMIEFMRYCSRRSMRPAETATC